MIYYSRICKDNREKSQQLCDDGQPQMSDSESREYENRKLKQCTTFLTFQPMEFHLKNPHLYHIFKYK
jgi:hypothetical protein